MTEPRADITLFIKNVWFFLFFFALLMLIASFGLVAEAAPLIQR